LGGDKKPKGIGGGSSVGTVREEGECQIPCGCEDKDPQEYKNWGKHQLSIKKHSDLNEIVDMLIDSEIYQVSWHTEKRKDLPSKKFLALNNYEVVEFTVFCSAEKGKKTRSEEKPKSSQALEADMWSYTCWEYKDKLDLQKLTDEERALYWHTEERTDIWFGDDNRTIWSTSFSPISEGERVYVKGKLMQGETYTIDLAKGELEFAEPPPENEEIRVHYLVIKVAPGDPKKGASLERWHECFQQDTREGDGISKTFAISGGVIKKYSERVYVKEKLMLGGIDYMIDRAKGEITFNEPPPALDEIKVIYSDNILQSYACATNKKDFEESKRDAVDRLKLFSEVFKNANPERYKQTFEKKIDRIKDSIEEWAVPFPSRVLKDDIAHALRKVEFSCRCKKCNTTWTYHPSNPPSIEGAKCPKGCKAPFEVTNFADLYEPPEDTIASLETDEQSEGQIKKELEKTCDVEPLAVYFKVDEPKTGNKTPETEQDILSDPKELEEAAKNLAEQLRKVKNEGAHARVTFRGYADTSAGCLYNETLSLARATWVQIKIKDMLKTKNIELPVNFTHGCGKALAQRRKKSGGYKADAHRAVIIELEELKPSNQTPQREERALV
jgi:hypothetical protein